MLPLRPLFLIQIGFLATFGDQVPAVWPQSPCRLTSWFRFTAASPKVAKSPRLSRYTKVPYGSIRLLRYLLLRTGCLIPNLDYARQVILRHRNAVLSRG